jgi:hypothetical protein
LASAIIAVLNALDDGPHKHLARNAGPGSVSPLDVVALQGRRTQPVHHGKQSAMLKGDQQASQLLAAVSLPGLPFHMDLEFTGRCTEVRLGRRQH